MNNRQITEKLENEHRQIVEILASAYKGNGLASGDWKDKLIEAQRIFMNHLDHEDETIYNDTFFNEKRFGGYGATAKRFQDEMKDITVTVEKFFKKYAETTDSRDFNRDYAVLVNALEKRIKAEESILFKEFHEMA